MFVAGTMANDEPRSLTGTVLSIICAVIGTVCLGSLVSSGKRRGQRPHLLIDPGEYRVFMLKVAGDKVVVAVTLQRRFGGAGYRFYELPIGWFEQEPECFEGPAMLMMFVVMKAEGLRITLSHKVKFRIVTANNHHDPA
jgi:hypothetical protein